MHVVCFLFYESDHAQSTLNVAQVYGNCMYTERKVLRKHLQNYVLSIAITCNTVLTKSM